MKIPGNPEPRFQLSKEQGKDHMFREGERKHTCLNTTGKVTEAGF